MVTSRLEDPEAEPGTPQQLPTPQPAEQPGSTRQLHQPNEAADTDPAAAAPAITWPAELAPADADTAAPPADASPQAEKWPHLSPQTLDAVWQQAINDGPATIGRQIAYALAASLKHSSPPAPAAPGESLTAPTLRAASLLALTAHAGQLSVPQRISLLDEAQTVADPANRTRALLQLAPYLFGEMRRVALRSAYQAALDVPQPSARAHLLADLLPVLRATGEDDLPGGIVAEALDVASQLNNSEARLRGLTTLTPFLPQTPRLAVLLAVLDTIAALSQPDTQASALAAIAPHLVPGVHHRALTVAAHISHPVARARALTVLADALPERLQPRLRAAALETIATVTGDEERARALAAFAPHLEAMAEGEEAFPILLERALTLAVDMRRRGAMALALVGLQARLPRELKGEALAAVNAIEDDHARAQLLAELAPSLPSDLAVAALAVAHDISERDARFLALKALGKSLRDKAAERTWLDAFAVALALEHQLERVLALAELAPNLPPELAYRALTNALTAARSIGKERARVRALATLAPLLADHQQLLADALADAYTITNAEELVSALIALVPYLPAGAPRDKAVGESLEKAREISVEYRRARVLVSLAPDLYGEFRREAVDIALAIEDSYDRASTLIALLPGLEGDMRLAVMNEAWDTAQRILEQYDRATALAHLWPHATSALKPDILRGVLDAVRDIADEYDRASGLSVFAPLLEAHDLPLSLPSDSQVVREGLLAAVALDDTAARARALQQYIPEWLAVQSGAVAYALWCEVHQLLSRRPVTHLLSDLAVLAPVVQKLGGPGAARESLKAIAATRAWK
ncbi:MAG: hypothetical protein JW910_21985 [Anaerolineae bacterium]|nr:hypothetical protein [Anaerolineae bacterium]